MWCSVLSRYLYLLLVAVLLIILIVLAVFKNKRGEAVLKASINVDPSVKLKFKDLKGVNCGPLSPRGWNKNPSLNLTQRYLELGVKVIRFHDLYGADDLDTIFPDPRADPDEPFSYNFKELDKHVIAAMKVADVLIFRIGYDWHDSPKNWPHTGIDLAAQVAAHIVMHYTQGWANGYRFRNILWEVWNEPDIDRFWNGTAEQYFQLYDKVVRAIKRVNPEAKVGGPTIAYNLEFLDRFLNYTRTHKVPIDFVSWHIYTRNPRDIAERAKQVKEIMEKHGYAELPSILDEWNYWWNEEPWDTFRSALVAAFQASALAVMEDAPLDVATLYRGDAWNWGGIFYSDGKPGKPFYAWLAYKKLIEDAVRVKAYVEGADIAVLAAKKPDKELVILVSNYFDQPVEYTLNVTGDYRLAKVLAVDAEHNLEPVNVCYEDICRIGPQTVQLIVMSPK